MKHYIFFAPKTRAFLIKTVFSAAALYDDTKRADEATELNTMC